MNSKKEDMELNSPDLNEVFSGEEILVFDGAFGTMLQARGLASRGVLPDLLNLSHPEEITAIHKSYVEAGSDVATTNTFGANRLKLEGRASVEEVYAAAACNARASGARFVAGDIGPTGELLEPLGTFSFEQAVDVFAEQVRAIDDAGCDFIIIETQTDIREAKAAVIAAKENCGLPIVVTMSFGEDGRTFLGTPPEAAAATFSALGVAAFGMNCSLGPNAILPLAKRMIPYLRCPLVIQPNAGMPAMVDGMTVYDLSPREYASCMEEFLDIGATIVGGCCGTNPEYIKGLREVVERRKEAICKDVHDEACSSPTLKASSLFTVASSMKAVSVDPLSYDIAVIGENINPTRRKKLKEAVLDGDTDVILAEALREQDSGADILDVNVGVPGVDEAHAMKDAVEALQGIVECPLQIDSSSPAAIEAAVRIYGGKPLINSVNGKQETLDAILPIAKKYGCAVLGLTLDEKGIPETADKRLRIAERIVKADESYGIDRADVAIDCLVMTAATNQAQVPEIFRTLNAIKRKLGVATVLGVSNVSFGLPDRELLNATFMAAAVGAGLDMPIINPCNDAYMDAVYALRVANGQDDGAEGYISTAESRALRMPAAGAASSDVADGSAQTTASANAGFIASLPTPEHYEGITQLVSEAVEAILSGRANAMEHIAESLLEEMKPLDIIDSILVPTLDEVGARYERGESYLPQLISSAESAKVVFDAIKEITEESGDPTEGKPLVIMATVQGDIHDIGKNIVVMLLENYGFDVIDLGFDVPADEVLKAARESGARLVGLSALMTTTVDSMAGTIKLIHDELPGVKVMVGGAVLTSEFADSIEADYYSRDAAEAVKVAQRFFDSN